MDPWIPLVHCWMENKQKEKKNIPKCGHLFLQGFNYYKHKHVFSL